MTVRWRVGIAVLLAWLTLGGQSFAQQVIPTTTLLNPITSTSQTQVIVVNGAGIATYNQQGTLLPTTLFIDGEAMSVSTVSGNVFQVVRGTDGTLVGTHNTTAVVYGGPSTAFSMPDPPLGSCTAALQPYTLRINDTGGRIWKCVSSVWVLQNMPYPPNVNQYAVVIGGTIGQGYSSVVAATSGYVLTSAGTNVAPAWSPVGSGAGSVTSVAATVPAGSLFGVTGSPIVIAGTLGLTTTGSSGGVPYFSDANTLSSSSALTVNGVVLGGGAGAAPTVVAAGTTNFVLTSNGTNVAPSYKSAGSGTVTATGITMPGSIFAVSSSPVTSAGTFGITVAGTSGGVVYFSSGSTLAGSNALTANGVVLGGGAGTAPTVVAPGTVNYVLTSTGTNSAPSYQAVAGTGTVTSIGFTVPNSIFAMTTSPIVAAGTFGLTVTGTSGGVPYFSSSSAIGSSGALAANGVVIGGGAGAAPTTVSAGTINYVLTSTGTNSAPTYQASASSCIGGCAALGNSNTFTVGPEVLSQSLNSGPYIGVTNANAGSAAYSELQVANASATGSLDLYGANFSGLGAKSASALVLQGQSGVTALNFLTVSASPIQFFTNNGSTPNVVIASGGLVGIGTASPVTKLQLSGAGPDASGLSITNTNAGGRTWYLEAGETAFNAGAFLFRDIAAGTIPLSIAATTGRIGIGTTSPGAALEVIGSGRITGLSVGNNTMSTCCGALNVVGDFRMNGATSGYVGFKSPSVAGSTNYTWPASDGTNGFVLSTDGAGNLAWIAAGGGGGGGLTGSGVANSIPKWSSSSNLTTSSLVDYSSGVLLGPVEGWTSFASYAPTSNTGSYIVQGRLAVGGSTSWLDGNAAVGNCGNGPQYCAIMGISGTDRITIHVENERKNIDTSDHVLVQAEVNGDSGNQTTGQNIAFYAPVGGNDGGVTSFLANVTGTTGTDYGLHINHDSVTEWPLYIFSTSASAVDLSVDANGSISAPRLPTSAGSGGLYLCVDNTGVIYKKSSCP